MYTYMPNYASLGQGQHVFPLPLSTIPQMYNVNTCPIGFSLPVSSNITTNVYTVDRDIHCIYMYMYIQEWIEKVKSLGCN